MPEISGKAAPTTFNHRDQEYTINKDQAKGHFREVVGSAKEVSGKVVGNKELEQKGQIENASGKVQAGFGNMKETLRKANAGK